jgi:membrane protein involved in colicin uptake
MSAASLDPAKLALFQAKKLSHDQAVSDRAASEAGALAARSAAEEADSQIAASKLAVEQSVLDLLDDLDESGSPKQGRLDALIALQASLNELEDARDSKSEEADLLDQEVISLSVIIPLRKKHLDRATLELVRP